MRTFARFLLAVSSVSVTVHAQWSQTSLDSVTITALYANASVVIAGTDTNGVFRSTDRGVTWSHFNQGLTEGTVVYKFAESGSNILMGKGGRVYRTATAGIGWTPSSSGMTDTSQIYAFAVSGGTVYASVVGGFYRSIDNGASWTEQGADQGISCIVVLPSGLLAGTNGGSTVRSTDLGVSWNPFGSGVAAMITYDLEVVGSNLLLGTLDGVFRSTNDGSTWSAANTGLTNSNVRQLVAENGHVFAGTGNGVFVSTNDGTSWSDISTGLLAPFVLSLASDGTYLYSSSETGLWRRPLSEVVTSIDAGPATPSEVRLDPAFPNPFNPSTVLTFQIPGARHVRLSVFDPIGREVAVLVDEERPGGTHAATWDAEGMPSGLYLCRLVAGEFTQMRKVVLLK